MTGFEYALGLLSVLIGLTLGEIATDLHRLVRNFRTVWWDGPCSRSSRPPISRTGSTSPRGRRCGRGSPSSPSSASTSSSPVRTKWMHYAVPAALLAWELYWNWDRTLGAAAG
ncbi:MAG TPA: hypothetical protein VF650_05730 [Allosphingosinicella sp.]